MEFSFLSYICCWRGFGILFRVHVYVSYLNGNLICFYFLFWYELCWLWFFFILIALYTHWIHYFLILWHCCLLPGSFSTVWRFLFENLQKSHFHFYFLIIFLFEGLLVGLCVVCGPSINSISFFVELYRCSHRNL